MTPDEIATLVGQLGDIMAVLAEADPADKAEVYRQLGLRLTWDHETQTAHAEIDPLRRWEKVGVRGEIHTGTHADRQVPRSRSVRLTGPGVAFVDEDSPALQRLALSETLNDSARALSAELPTADIDWRIPAAWHAVVKALDVLAVPAGRHGGTLGDRLHVRSGRRGSKPAAAGVSASCRGWLRRHVRRAGLEPPARRPPRLILGD
jgi:hypothetical protein